MEAAFADAKAKDSLALWERWQPKADGEGNGEGNNHALSPADAGALPKGEPWFASSESLSSFPDKHCFCGCKTMVQGLFRVTRCLMD